MLAPSAPAAVLLVTDDAELDAALALAEDGDEIVLAPGTYSGGRFVAGLVGVTLRSQDPRNPAVIDAGGSGQGLQLSDPERVTLESLVFRNAGSNGLNVDDGGSFSTPARGLVIRDVHVEGSAPAGNLDGIKLSGVVDFHIDRVRIVDWGTGGSAIDMVGCHDGLIENSLFEHRSGGSSGVQQKGGTRGVELRANRFVDAGSRAINMGGSTGLQFFRPQPPGPVEAGDLLAVGNVILGSQTPVAYVNVDGGAVFQRNYVERPTAWAARILKETDAPGFVDTQGGTYSDNVVVWETGDLRTGINVGPGTLPASFPFERNAWFNATDPGSSDPGGLSQVAEAGSVFGVDPMLDPDAPIGWTFAWGVWAVNASEAQGSFDLAGRGPLLVATPGPGARLDLLADDPLVGTWTLSAPPSMQLELEPFSQIVLVPEPGGAPARAAALLGLVAACAASRRRLSQKAPEAVSRSCMIAPG